MKIKKCKNCGHAQRHHHMIRTFEGKPDYRHCYYPSKKAKNFECNCTYFEEIKDEKKM